MGMLSARAMVRRANGKLAIGMLATHLPNVNVRPAAGATTRIGDSFAGAIPTALISFIPSSNGCMIAMLVE